MSGNSAAFTPQLLFGPAAGQLLKRACANGNMSRSGIQEALFQSTNITTDKLVADLNFAKPGAPAARETSVGVPDARVLGGIREVKPLFVASDAQSYVAAHRDRRLIRQHSL